MQMKSHLTVRVQEIYCGYARTTDGIVFHVDDLPADGSSSRPIVVVPPSIGDGAVLVPLKLFNRSFLATGTAVAAAFVVNNIFGERTLLDVLTGGGAKRALPPALEVVLLFLEESPRSSPR